MSNLLYRSRLQSMNPYTNTNLVEEIVAKVVSAAKFGLVNYSYVIPDGLRNRCLSYRESYDDEVERLVSTLRDRMPDVTVEATDSNKYIRIKWD